MKLLFSPEAKRFLEKKITKTKRRLNLALHAEEIKKSCYLRIEPTISFETDQNYLEGIDKLGSWNEKIDIYIDPVIKPLLQKKDEIRISLKGRVFKRLYIENNKPKIKLQCKVT
ncbi:MAG: hypothetical protein ACTSRS_05285 [Candidatus Helarchaeota archaeon]